jgi:hypothetical protein
MICSFQDFWHSVQVYESEAGFLAHAAVILSEIMRPPDSGHCQTGVRLILSRVNFPKTK